jgi:hypothetical protein
MRCQFFHVGESVEVAVRTLSSGPTVLYPANGATRIIKRKLNDSLQWVYDVEFVDRNGKREDDVLSQYLSHCDIMIGAVKKPRRGV